MSNTGNALNAAATHRCEGVKTGLRVTRQSLSQVVGDGRGQILVLERLFGTLKFHEAGRNCDRVSVGVDVEKPQRDRPITRITPICDPNLFELESANQLKARDGDRSDAGPRQAVGQRIVNCVSNMS